LPDYYSSTFTNIGKLSRDVTVYGPSFWCIQGIGAYEGPTDSDFDGETVWTLGGAVNNSTGVFMVFDETIRDLSNTASGYKSSVTMGLIVAFHEVLHLFGLDHPDGGVMADGSSNPDPNGIYLYEPNALKTANTRSDYLLPEHIQKVQKLENKQGYPH